MRKPRRYETANGPRWRVRFRQGGTETSETFRTESDAATFAAIVSNNVTDALAWIAERDKQSSAMTLREWLPIYVDQLTGVTPRTRADHHNQARRYLTTIMDLPLPLLTRSHVTTIVNDLEADGKAPKTIKNLVHMMSSVFALAVDDGHMTKNPCRKVRLPSAALDATEARFLEESEFAAIYAATPTHYQPLVAFLVGTGLRWSEATALEARHVSIDRGTVRVERAWKWAGKGAGWVLGVPKSAKSKRTVNAAVFALGAVKALLGKPKDLVFITPTGRAVRHNNFYNRIWKPTLLKASLCDDHQADTEPCGCVPDLTATRIHDLRHTHASWLISDGQSLEAVQDQLGHESILTTRKVYGHLMPAVGVAVGKSASESLARALANAGQITTGSVAALEGVQAADEGPGSTG